MKKRWRWASASCIGTSHIKSGTRLQDAHFCRSIDVGTSNYIVVSVSDGAGSAQFGGEGASLVCHSLSRSVSDFIRKNASLPAESDVESFLDSARDRIYLAAERRGLTPRDFAATLVMFISNGVKSVFAHIGDGCSVCFDAEKEEWIAPSWPEHGEYASTTFFVTDDPKPRLRVFEHVGEVTAVVAFSDGLERLALDFSTQQPFHKFFAAMSNPIVASVSKGKDRDLSAKLLDYLASNSINSRTDDDKTLVIASYR